jgi:hypothetical protein
MTRELVLAKSISKYFWRAMSCACEKTRAAETNVNLDARDLRSAWQARVRGAVPTPVRA